MFHVDALWKAGVRAQVQIAAGRASVTSAFVENIDTDASNAGESVDEARTLVGR